MHRDVVNPPHHQPQHANHDHTSALHPRLSLQIPPITAITENTTLPHIHSPINTTTIIPNTTLPDIHTPTTLMENTNLHDINTTLHDFNTTAIMDNTNTLHDINTTHSIKTTCNDSSKDGFVNPTSSGTKKVCSKTTSGIYNSSSLMPSNNNGGFQGSSGDGVNSTTVMASARLDSGGGLKRKRDWMNSFTQPQLGESGMGKSSSLLTSVRITNGSLSFPAGWEQYLDLQTGETYYVNWNTRTKHCRVQCPEVQRCLAGAHEGHQEGTNYNGMKLKNIYHNDNINKNKDTIESWLSKMTATTSALVNNQPKYATKPPLPPTYPIKSSKKSPSLDLNLACITNKNNKNLSNVDTTFSLHDTTNVPTIPCPFKDLTSIDCNHLLNDNTINVHASTQAMHGHGFNSMHNPSFSPKQCNTSAISTPQFPSTPIEPAACVCSNCNMLVLFSSLTTTQCPSCNNALNTWPADTIGAPFDMSFGPLPTLEASSGTTNA